MFWCFAVGAVALLAVTVVNGLRVYPLIFSHPNGFHAVGLRSYHQYKVFPRKFESWEMVTAADAVMFSILTTNVYIYDRSLHIEVRALAIVGMLGLGAVWTRNRRPSETSP